MSSPKCFISYSWDSEAHKKWVRNLAEHLTKNGIEILLDQWDLKPGSDFPSYMETSVRESDYVILVCTQDFAQKANVGKGGVGYEKCIVTGEVFQCISSPEKFVPILRSGNEKDSIPSYLKHKVFVDFRDDHVFQRSLEDLLRHFHDIPRYVRPGIGSKPSLNNRKNVSIESYKGNRYCSYCGVLPGQKSSCVTLTGFHNFVLDQ